MEKLKAYASSKWAGEVIRMRMKILILIAVLTLFALNVAFAVGGMTDYERGVANGLKVGLFMGELYGRAQYAESAAREFNGYLEKFNAFLKDAFGTNQTLINEFQYDPIPVSAPQTGGMPEPDANGRIYGYPAEAYYTAVGAVPGTHPENPTGGMPGI